MRWRRLKLDLDETAEVFQSNRCKTFHINEDEKTIRVEAKLGGDPAMVLLPYNDDEEKETIVDRLLGCGFIWEEIIVEPDK